MLFKMIPKMIPRQLKLPLKRWGGRRKGAGRPRDDGLRGPGVAHLTRPAVRSTFPVHVTWRMCDGVWNLRSQRCFKRLASAMWASVKPSFRVVHYSVMGNHVHFIVEARDRVALSRGMQGLGIRIARTLNRLMERSGRVLGDRYHAHILRTPTEATRARHYLLGNAHKHYAVEGPDPYASRVALVLPETFFLRQLE